MIGCEPVSSSLTKEYFFIVGCDVTKGGGGWKCWTHGKGIKLKNLDTFELDVKLDESVIDFEVDKFDY